MDDEFLPPNLVIDGTNRAWPKANVLDELDLIVFLPSRLV